MKPIGHVEFRCVVVEDGEHCNNRHLEPYVTLIERANIEGCGFICQEHLKSYQWATRLYSHVDETATLADQILKDPTGVRNEDFRSRSGSGISVSPEQMNSGLKGTSAFKNWILACHFPEFGDYLMKYQPFEEIKPPRGMARNQFITPKDVFDEGFN